ncbi:hypothetical protein KAW80_02800 [Candidatus Babeliales bacterium]|nr:hypothetical protein [Candidatus Babeliales bacterium]
MKNKLLLIAVTVLSFITSDVKSAGQIIFFLGSCSEKSTLVKPSQKAEELQKKLGSEWLYYGLHEHFHLSYLPDIVRAMRKPLCITDEEEFKKQKEQLKSENKKSFIDAMNKLLEKKNLIVDIAALTEFNVLNILKNLKTKTTVFVDSNLTIKDDVQSLVAKPKLDKNQDKKYYDLRIKSSEKQLEEFADIISKELKASPEYTKKFYITISLFAGIFDTATPKLERFLT